MNNLDLQANEKIVLQSIFSEAFQELDSSFQVTIQIKDFESPLILVIKYHNDYPSSSPPFLDLKASWLTPHVVENLKKELEALFHSEKEKLGVIVFYWIDW